MSHLLQMRGLKLKAQVSETWSRTVASFTDAWIETLDMSFGYLPQGSHLLQMRGLKLLIYLILVLRTVSHLLQMRGLKRRKASSETSIPFRRIFYRCVD